MFAIWLRPCPLGLGVSFSLKNTIPENEFISITVIMIISCNFNACSQCRHVFCFLSQNIYLVTGRYSCDSHVDLRQTLESVSKYCHMIERLFFESSKTGNILLTFGLHYFRVRSYLHCLLCR